MWKSQGAAAEVHKWLNEQIHTGSRLRRERIKSSKAEKKPNHNQPKILCIHLYVFSIDVDYIATETGSPFRDSFATQSPWALWKQIHFWKWLQEAQIIPV